MKNVIKTLFVKDEALFYSLLLGGIAWVLVVLRSLGVINKGVDNLIFVGLFASGGAIPAIVGYFRGKRTWFACIAGSGRGQAETLNKQPA
jgi:hypothetical protein